LSSQSAVIQSRRASASSAFSVPVIAWASTGDTAGSGQDLAGAEQSLARHASPVRTLAADQLVLNQNSRESGVDAPADRVLTRGAAAKDDHVKHLCHCAIS
jgi:hypothetical protein